MKVAAFEQVSGLHAGGVAIISPNWNKFSEKRHQIGFRKPKIPAEIMECSGYKRAAVRLVDEFHFIPFIKSYIPDFRFWCFGEAAKTPGLLGKRFAVHDICHEPYCFDLYFRQRKPEKVGMMIRDQLDEMAAIMGDRPYVICDDSEFPARTWPYSTRRNAWAIRGGKVVDRPEIITKQEVALTLMWLRGQYIDGHQMPPRLRRIIEVDGRAHLKPGEIEPHVAEWRQSPACWPDSRFEQPKEANFDLKWYGRAAA